MVLTSGTKIEHNTNIQEQENAMTDILRDIAAFASITLFVASLSVIVMGM